MNNNNKKTFIYFQSNLFVKTVGSVQHFSTLPQKELSKTGIKTINVKTINECEFDILELFKIINLAVEQFHVATYISGSRTRYKHFCCWWNQAYGKGKREVTG